MKLQRGDGILYVRAASTIIVGLMSRVILRAAILPEKKRNIKLQLCNIYVQHALSHQTCFTDRRSSPAAHLFGDLCVPTVNFPQ